MKVVNGRGGGLVEKAMGGSLCENVVEFGSGWKIEWKGRC